MKWLRRMIGDIASELKLVLYGKSMDILLPPLVFLITNMLWGIMIALIVSLLVAVIFLMKRVYQKDNLYYAVFGTLGVIGAVIVTYLSANASNFFLSDMIGTVLLILVTFVSLVKKKPLAIWVSHITRGWDLKWFYRDDVKPAYKEVTIFWLFFFVFRLGVEITLYIWFGANELAIANIVLGFPVLIVVLTISYVYGIYRLHQLKGPGIDEFMEQKEPPYRGQYKGF